MARQPIEKTYLGDGVYITQGDWGGQLVMTTENGLGAQNTIYLDEEVTSSLYNLLRTKVYGDQ